MDVLALLKKQRARLISDKKRGLVTKSGEESVNRKIQELTNAIEVITLPYFKEYKEGDKYFQHS